jgi:N-acetylglucosamine-6-sulfatase
MGKIFAALEETRQLDNTIIMFTSDNGFLWGEHALTDKRVPYDESIRIPLLIRYPRLIRAGTRLRNFVLTTDLAPTLVEISRSSPLGESKGRSLVPLLQGRARGWRSSFIFEYFEDPQAKTMPSWQAIRTDRWKYIRYTNLEGMDEIYDLASDPYEMRNLINDPSAQDVLSDSKEELARLWRETF